MIGTSNNDVICLETIAFYRLIDEVVARLEQHNREPQYRWVYDQEAMALLGITSRTTLQKYRDEGRIRYTQPSKKVILYDRESILAFLDKHAKDTF